MEALGEAAVVAFVAVQLFSQSTLAEAEAEAEAAAAGRQAVAGVVVRYTEPGEPTMETFSAQGLDPAGLDRTLDLEVRSGDLGDLRCRAG